MTSPENPIPDNAAFYGSEGRFDSEAARETIFAMAETHGYPVNEHLRKNLWVTDFGLGDFVHVGMGCVVWVNEIADGYSARELFLLPHQMIAEHTYHPTGIVRAKINSWHLRCGEAFAFGEEGVPPPSRYRIPGSQKEEVSLTLGQLLMPGGIVKLNRPGAFHFLMAGHQGAIVSEYGTADDTDAVVFQNPRAVN